MRNPSRAILWVFGLAIAITRSSSAQEKRLLRPEDFSRIRTVSDPQISPDGGWIAYAVKTLDLAKDKSATNLWLASWNGSQNFPMTFGEETQTHARFSPDGAYIAFLSSRGDTRENDQLWLLNRKGDVREGHGDEGNVDFAWSPDGKKLVLAITDPDPSAPDPTREEKDKKAAPPSSSGGSSSAGQDRLVDRHTHLFLFDSRAWLDPLTSGARRSIAVLVARQAKIVRDRRGDARRTDSWDIYVVEASWAAERSYDVARGGQQPDWRRTGRSPTGNGSPTSRRRSEADRIRHELRRSRHRRRGSNRTPSLDHGSRVASPPTQLAPVRRRGNHVLAAAWLEVNPAAGDRRRPSPCSIWLRNRSSLATDSRIS